MIKFHTFDGGRYYLVIRVELQRLSIRCITIFGPNHLGIDLSIHGDYFFSANIFVCSYEHVWQNAIFIRSFAVSRII